MNFETSLSKKLERFGLILLVVMIVFLLLIFICSCGRNNKEPAIDWDKSPDAKIIYVSDPIQFPALSPTWQDVTMDNHLPEGQVFGDGRIIWVEYYRADQEDARRVMEGRLTEVELRSLLEQISEKGYFSWKDHYSRGFDERDGPPNTIMRVALEDRYKQVLVSSGAPAGFHELVRLITTGAGVIGREYMPERGYLKVYPSYYYNQDEVWQLPLWPSEEAGFHLEERVYERGQYIEGPLLEFVWQVINDCPRQPDVLDQGEAYTLIILLPGLSDIAVQE